MNLAQQYALKWAARQTEYELERTKRLVKILEKIENEMKG